ncbi:MAG: carboxypeptidase regulatory-like domain-containing protein [Pirellulales bacterium]|nr:carboxypeptidase regulatory-like domain-containing protein [Pirellulales bacterium]
MSRFLYFFYLLAMNHSLFQGPYRVLVGAALFGILICCGCQPSLEIAPVSGTITYEGRPLPGATITTQPMTKEGSQDPGPGSFGKTDADGHYTLELVSPARQGAIVGTHRVTISRSSATKSTGDAWSGDAYRGDDRGWPERYTNGSLTLEVPAGGRTDADFKLTAK